MAAGVEAAGFEARRIPLADGGEGTLEALVAARGGSLRSTSVTGPLGEPVEAEWALLPEGTGVIEMARASGLSLVRRNDPLRASTRGTGELINAVLRAGARRVIVGAGGSATTDGGLAAVEALGWSLGGAEVVVACDVSTMFVVVTGEGKLDGTSFDGKVVGGVLDWAADAGVRHVAVIAGQATTDARDELA